MSKLFLIIGLVLIQIPGICKLSNERAPTFNDSVRYIIVTSSHDGQNMTKFDRERGGVILFEFDGKTLVNMSNLSEIDKSKSFGQITNFKTDTVYTTGGKYKHLNILFDWNFKNDYDADTGIAKVKFQETESSYGTNFMIQITIQKTGELIEYFGYREGAKNPDVLTETIW